MRKSTAARAVVAMLSVVGLALPQGAVPALGAVRPVVTQLAALSGPIAGGDFVTLHGTGFTRVRVVSFGGARTGSFHVWSDREITVRAPRHGAGRVYVRVAAPGRASGYSTSAVYTYVLRPAPLAPTGVAVPAPAAIAPSDVETPTDLSCTAATFCAAVGPGGASVYTGATWGPVQSFGSPGREVVCTSATFCMALTADGHAWRYSGSGWSDLGDQGQLRALSCGGPSLCGALRPARPATPVLYRAGGWDAAPRLVTSFPGFSCFTPTRCVGISDYGTYRVLDNGAWGTVRDMWLSAQLRASQRYAVTGELACTSTSYCLAAGPVQESGGDVKYSVRSGSTWSLVQRQPTRGSYPLALLNTSLSCVATTFCVKGDYLEDNEGRGSVDWTVFNGTSLSSTGAALGGTHQMRAISCWSPYECLGIGNGTSMRVTAG